MNTLDVTVDTIESVLPQTQCGLCGYAGCRPYAEAIVQQGETIDRCPPGGVDGLMRLAACTQQNPAPYIATVKAKAQPVRVARIDEAVCIGCTKCLVACPVDAILGAGKQMHTVIEAECSGCERCLAPCPVDCIEMITVAPAASLTAEERQQRANQYRSRFEQRNARRAREQAARSRARQRQRVNVAHPVAGDQREQLVARQQAIAAAVQREQAKRANVQDSNPSLSHHVAQPGSPSRDLTSEASSQ